MARTASMAFPPAITCSTSTRFRPTPYPRMAPDCARRKTRTAYPSCPTASSPPCSTPIRRIPTRPRLMPCIRAWLQPCRGRQSIQGFSPCCPPPCQVRETIGELLGPLDQSRLHRVARYVFAMLDESLPTLHARLGEATLPDLSPMTVFLLQAV